MITCNLENIWLEQNDFDCIGQVAKHCDWNQLCIYIREQKNLYLLPKIGYCLMKKIEENLTDPTIIKLLCGGEYNDTSGNLRYFFGLKRVLIHASYGNYILRHGAVDTPFGVVQKLHNDSLPVPMNELKSIQNEHYKNADMYFMEFENFINANITNPLISSCFNSVNGCGIKNNNELQIDTQRRQYTFNNISK